MSQPKQAPAFRRGEHARRIKPEDLRTEGLIAKLLAEPEPEPGVGDEPVREYAEPWTLDVVPKRTRRRSLLILPRKNSVAGRELEALRKALLKQMEGAFGGDIPVTTLEMIERAVVLKSHLACKDQRIAEAPDGWGELLKIQKAYTSWQNSYDRIITRLDEISRAARKDKEMRGDLKDYYDVLNGGKKDAG